MEVTPCNPCFFENIQVKATHFCRTCEDPEPLCKTCAREHVRHKISRNHEISDNIREFPNQNKRYDFQLFKLNHSSNNETYFNGFWNSGGIYGHFIRFWYHPLVKNISVNNLFFKNWIRYCDFNVHNLLTRKISYNYQTNNKILVIHVHHLITFKIPGAHDNCTEVFASRKC